MIEPLVVRDPSCSGLLNLCVSYGWLLGTFSCAARFAFAHRDLSADSLPPSQNQSITVVPGQPLQVLDPIPDNDDLRAAGRVRVIDILEHQEAPPV